MILLETPAIEQSTYAIDVSFTDENGVPLTPNSGLTWSLVDTLGVIVNSRQDVAIAAASTITVVLSGNDLALSSTLLSTWRKLLVEGTYNSSLGSNLPLRQEVTFNIEPLAGVS